MGQENRAPKMSIMNMFQEDNLVIYLIQRTEIQYELLMGVWEGKVFQGISTINSLTPKQLQLLIPDEALV